MAPQRIQGAVTKRRGMDPEQTSRAAILYTILFPRLKCKHLENKSSVFYFFLSHTMTTSVPYYSEGSQIYLLISLDMTSFICEMKRLEYLNFKVCPAFIMFYEKFHGNESCGALY